MTPRTTENETGYGLVGFIAAVITVAIFETIAWAWFPYVYADLMLFLAVSAVVVPAAFFMSRARGTTAQIGRGVLLGCLAAPLSAAIIIAPTLILANLHQIG